jgi:hypothetical protein
MRPRDALQFALGNMDIHGNMIGDFDPAVHKVNISGVVLNACTNRVISA